MHLEQTKFARAPKIEYNLWGRRRTEGASKLNPREGTRLARSNFANPSRPSNESVQPADRDGTAPDGNRNEPRLRGSSGAARRDRIACMLAREAKRGAEAAKDGGGVVRGEGGAYVVLVPVELRAELVRCHGRRRRAGVRRRGGRDWRRRETARRVETDDAKQLRSKVSWVVVSRLYRVVWLRYYGEWALRSSDVGSFMG
jgi:hypothetical protein